MIHKNNKKVNKMLTFLLFFLLLGALFEGNKPVNAKSERRKDK
jgi:hypothetical protein